MAELTAALAEEWEPTDRAMLELTEIQFRAKRGETMDDRIAEIRLRVGDGADPQTRANVEDTAGSAAFASGDLAGARSAWRQAGDLAANFPAISLPRAARAALWAGDGLAAREDITTLDESGFHGPAIEADRLTIRAGIAALEGRSADALRLYREALRAWRDLGLAWDEALCGIDMATLLDPTEPEVRAAAEAARAILVRLEAAPFIARLDAATARAKDA